VRKFVKVSVIAILAISSFLVLAGPTTAFAATATTPVLGKTLTFGILSSTYTNTAVGTTINGDLGYTTGPAVLPTINGTKYVAESTYNQAGLDQATALAELNSQSATFTFAPGAIDLASDTTHGAIGVYTPGVYSITGAANIGGGGTITLNGAGTYIFRMDGALNTSADSKVIYINGASPCDIFWTPTQATTLGANSTFVGTDIDASGITIGSTVTWTGRALAFGGTVSTAADTITVPDCAATETSAVATLAAADAAAAATLAAENAANAAAAAKLPNTGVGQTQNSMPWIIVIPVGIFAVAILLCIIRRKETA